MQNFLKEFFIIISNIGRTEIIMLLLIILCLILFFYKKEKYWPKFILTYFFITATITYILKKVIAKERPANSLIQETGYSFPSGHTAIAATIFFIIFYYSFHVKNKKHKLYMRIFATIWLALIISARLYLRVHDIYDILGSLLISLFIYYLLRQTIFQKAK